ncbi:MAG: hypothetical protein ABIP94_03750 [Planctomycetota bacterium]
MNSPHCLLLLSCLPVAEVMAQVPGALLTFSQPENTISMGGGPLQVLHPNEIAFLPLQPGCPNGARTEKWSPRTCLNVMAGDENGDGHYWNPNLFGAIDALSTGFGYLVSSSSIGKIAPNPRMVFWSPSAVMGTAITNPPLRPGDIGRIRVNGTVERLMTQEQFNKALGLPPGTQIDIDAFAYEPGLGIYFSLDTDIVCDLACSPGNFVQDGDLLVIPDSAITYYSPTVQLGDFRVMNVMANSAHVILTEGLLDWYVANSGITDRNGAPITLAIDLESLDIDHGPGTQVTVSNTCGTVLIPNFLFSTESMTGGSLASTIGLGQPAMGPCGFLGIPQPYGLQTGAAVGIQQQLATVGPASYVNALAFGTTERFVLEPVVHQQNYGLLGGPATTVHVGGDFNYVFTWIDIVPNTFAPSITVPGNFFPDWYCLSLTLWDFGAPVNGFHSFATPTIPVGWSGKLMFQSLGFDVASTTLQLDLSTPCVIDVN